MSPESCPAIPVLNDQEVEFVEIELRAACARSTRPVLDGGRDTKKAVIAYKKDNVVGGKTC